MTESKTPLARFVEPDLSDARLERQLGNIRDRLGSRAPRSKTLLFALAASAIVALAIAIWLVRAPRSTPVANAPEGGERVSLADGSVIALEAHAVLHFESVEAHNVRIALESGAVECEVTHDDNRSFRIAAGGYEVVVVGTHFTVRVQTGRVSVSVARGVVEVGKANSSEAPRRLGAGENWSAAIEPSAPPSSETAAESVAPESSNAPAVSAEPATTATTRAVESAKQLFERAERARAAGRTAEAREALLALRARYPNDSRAGLAAFELARMEQDDQKDPKAASKLLGEAIEKAPAGSPMREDAEARRVEALDAAGDHAGCRAARNAFLSRYPHSVNRARVQNACPNP